MHNPTSSKNIFPKVLLNIILYELLIDVEKFGMHWPPVSVAYPVHFCNCHLQTRPHTSAMSLLESDKQNSLYPGGTIYLDGFLFEKRQAEMKQK